MPDKERLVPAPDDETAGFFEAARRHELAIRVCSRCGATLHLPRSWCAECRAGATEWRVVKGNARLYSWTTVMHPAHPAFECPYTVVLVELAECPEVRLVGVLPGEPDLEPGMDLEVSFDDVGDGMTIPQFVPTAGR